jgi:hypothetical protein
VTCRGHLCEDPAAPARDPPPAGDRDVAAAGGRVLTAGPELPTRRGRTSSCALRSARFAVVTARRGARR